MANVKIGSGMFVLRETAQKDVYPVLEKLAEIGYDGIELLGFYGKEPDALRKKLDVLGLLALGEHVSLKDFQADPKGMIEKLSVLGSQTVTLGCSRRGLAPGDSEFDELALGVRAASELCVSAGITPLYHNHEHDVSNDGAFSDYILDACASSGLQFEPDVGWMVFAGADPEAYLAKYKGRCPVIHLKDIYADDLSKVYNGPGLTDVERDPARGGFAFRPTGYGIVNIPKLLPACLDAGAAWLVADHDHAYDRDAYYDMKLSCDYLKALAALY